MSVHHAHVLVVEDDADLRELLNIRLKRAGHSVTTAEDGVDGLAAMRKNPPDVAIVDLKLPRMSGIDLLKAIKSHRPDVEVIVVTAHGSVNNAVEAMQEGAYDFIQKPVDPELLEHHIRRVLELRNLRLENDALRQEQNRPFVTRSKKVEELMATVKRASQSDATVLILGESGTGKELMARSVHA